MTIYYLYIILYIYIYHEYCIKQVLSSWIDPDTNVEYHEVQSYYQTDKTYSLIFSDEFNVGKF